jgi:hypothetical protein
MVSTGTQRRETSFRCLNISDRAWEPQATETLGWLCNLVHPKEHPHACCHTGLFLHQGAAATGVQVVVLVFRSRLTLPTFCPDWLLIVVWYFTEIQLSLHEGRWTTDAAVLTYSHPLPHLRLVGRTGAPVLTYSHPSLRWLD